jgi:hypothetical protein
MVKYYLFSVLVAVGSSTFAQSDFQFTKDAPVIEHWVIDFSADENLEVVGLNSGFVAPDPYSKTDQIKAALDAKRERRSSIKSKVDENVALTPGIIDQFNGKPVGSTGIPLDNTLAVSNDGIIMSAINTSVNILDAEGNSLKFRTLSGMTAGQLGILDRFYDPKVLYDPTTDRFILVFLEGSNSDDTRIVVGFTQTNDPTGLWNFYAINGNPNGGAKWSDYPIIAHNKEDLYVTVNVLRDNESWQEGFVQSVIWQVNKASGYDGDTVLTQNLYSDIMYKNEPVWSICPVQPAIDMDQDNMYFLSVRPDAESNDTLLLHEITNTAASGEGTHTLTVLKSDQKYGVPPSSFQPTVGYRLQTNDTRVLSAALHEGQIQYVQSTIVPGTISSGIYHGTVSDVRTTPTVRGRIISSPTQDYAYPSIAFAGETDRENSMMLTFSHVSEDDFPGTSALFYNFKDGLYDNYSPVVMVKEGDDVINSFIADSMERWGDYTDIQPQYNDKGAVWLCGSYGDADRRNNVWIAKVRASNALLSVEEVFVYPNPADNFIKVSTVFDKNELVTVSLADIQGKAVKSIRDQRVATGKVEFLVDVSGIGAGYYVLTVSAASGETRYSQKVRID